MRVIAVKMSDFPKIQCPFVRKEFDVNVSDWEAHGSRLKLRNPKAYLVIDQINEGYEWVFEDKDTFATEKLDGTNVKLNISEGRLIGLQNRKNIIDLLQIIAGKTFIIEGVHRAVQKGYVNKDGVQAGEVIGPKLQGNPYKIDNHIWYPFTKAIKDLTYRSFHEHDRDFENWDSWFHKWLFSRFYQKTQKKGSENKVFAEGVVFYNLRRREEGRVYMAKLRRDMFPWFYEDEGVRIINFKK